uniref:MPV17 mitochondrial inner membrane protein like n=1 Tax=Aquila chrysaetos chrysaetos TaxID=223781 RepID=A0A663EXW0_AQUCH
PAGSPVRAASPPGTSASAPAGSTLAALTRPRREGRGTRSPRERHQARPAAERAAADRRAGFGAAAPAEGAARPRAVTAEGGESAARSVSPHTARCRFPGSPPLRLVEQSRRTTGEVTGMSILQRKEDIFSDCKKKFWNTYKTGLMYWPFVQLSNFILVPVYLRTAYTGLCGFVWATFICFSQQSGDGTAKSALIWLQREKANADEESSEK